jgi:hypothetical protein
MTTAAPSPLHPTARGELRQQRRRRRVDSSRTNRVLALVAVALVVVAVTLGVFAFLAWRDSVDTRDATKPLETRAAQLEVDLTTANTAIDRYTALFAAITAQADATTKAVDAANQAAQQYNVTQTGVAAAFGPDVTNTGGALSQTTAAVQTAVDGASTVLAELQTAGGANG